MAAAPVLNRLVDGQWVPTVGTLVAALLAAYSVAAFAPLRDGVGGGALVLAGVWLGWVWLESMDADLLFLGVFVAVSWLAGRASRAERARRETLRVLTERLEREQHAVGRLAVAEERARLAAEVQDAVAQSVTAMLDNAEAAEQDVASAPERAVALARCRVLVARRSKS